MARALGRYELLRPLARGGMAEVYLARRRAAGVEKWLVVKRMRPERSGDPRFLDLFVREARLSMSLVHQNIVPVFDFGRIDDQVFLAMERVEGKDLGSSLARAPGHCMPPLLAAFLAAECCQALDYAHQRKGPDGVALGIVHRDVTPRNVLLSWSGEVKLTDFGIAALAGEATSRLLGTPQYMAPEQARSEPIDPRADIYAVGLVLREALSGIRPRPGADRESILDAARRGVLLPWPSAAGPSVPPPSAELALGSGDHTPDETRDARDPPPADLVAIADRATAPAPGDRYPDARSMLEDLDHYMVAERARNKADSPARQLAVWLTRLWDGARDEAAADAAIEAEHLVSFLDDGAFDVIGTGTVRSLAATAADDARPDAADDPGSGAHSSGSQPIAAPLPPASPSASPTAAAATASPSPRRASESGGRSTRISSANTTVAAGSFDAIPARAGDDDRADAALPGRRRRSIAPLAIIALAGVAALAAVVVVTRSGGQDLRASDPPAVPAPTGPASATAAASASEPPNAPPPPAASQNAASPPAASPTAASQNAASPPAASQNAASQNAASQNAASQNAASQNATSPNAASPNSASPNSASPNSASPNAASPNAPSPNAASRTGGPLTTASPSTAPRGTAPQSAAPLTNSPSNGRPGPDRPSGRTSPGTGHTPSTPAVGSGGVATASCRVRINFTPWAYYTVDHDPSRHETPGTIDLAPGEHRLHVWNPELHIERDIALTVPADRDTMNFSEPLQPPALHSDAPKP